MQVQYTKNLRACLHGVGDPGLSGVGFFCFHALEDTKQKKLTPLDRGPPLHVNRLLTPGDLDWVQHWVIRIGLLLYLGDAQITREVWRGREGNEKEEKVQILLSFPLSPSCFTEMRC